jgi:hypothetical protein
VVEEVIRAREIATSNLIIYKFTKYIKLILKLMKNYRTIGGAMVVVGGELLLVCYPS